MLLEDLDIFLIIRCYFSVFHSHFHAGRFVLVAAVTCGDFSCYLPGLAWDHVHLSNVSAFPLDQFAFAIKTSSFTILVVALNLSKRLTFRSPVADLHLVSSKCFVLIGGLSSSLFSSNHPIVGRLMRVAVSLAARIKFLKKDE